MSWDEGLFSWLFSLYFVLSSFVCFRWVQLSNSQILVILPPHALLVLLEMIFSTGKLLSWDLLTVLTPTVFSFCLSTSLQTTLSSPQRLPSPLRSTTPISTQMEASVSIFWKTSGPLPWLFLRFFYLSALCWLTPTQTILLFPRLHTSTRMIDPDMRLQLESGPESMLSRRWRIKNKPWF